MSSPDTKTTGVPLWERLGIAPPPLVYATAPIPKTVRAFDVPDTRCPECGKSYSECDCEGAR